MNGDHAEGPHPEFFDRYLKEAAQWLSVVDLKHRGAAIKLSEHPLDTLDGVAMVKALCATLDGPWWQAGATSRGRNWVWREQAPPHTTESKEVVLERRLAERSTVRWTCQMSTSSGLRPGARDSRRSIDLVQQIQKDEYRFIELKVGSDHPVYAIFEVLAYGLLYLLARQNGWRGDGRYDVMTARRIELVVLAPHSWFTFKNSRTSPVSRFDFHWLEARINEGLSAQLRAGRGDGLNEMRLRSAAFDGDSSTEASVSAIEAILPAQADS